MTVRRLSGATPVLTGMSGIGPSRRRPTQVRGRISKARSVFLPTADQIRANLIVMDPSGAPSAILLGQTIGNTTRGVSINMTNACAVNAGVSTGDTGGLPGGRHQLLAATPKLCRRKREKATIEGN